MSKHIEHNHHSASEQQSKFEDAKSDGSSAYRLMPSREDFQNFQRAIEKTEPGRCDLPDYTIEGSDLLMKPTQKRLDYDKSARQALNSPDKDSDKPLTAKEEETAHQVAELMKKAQRDLATSTQNNDRDDDDKKLNEIFEKLSPDSAKRVIAETNKLLAGSNQRIAQAESGEIWTGYRDNKSELYHLDILVKPVECPPVA